MGLFILGMHRSGTSAVTVALHRLGLSLGDPAYLTPPNPNNPRGFWENRSLLRFNDALLAGLGGSWAIPPTTDSQWADHPRLASDLAEARELFARVYPSSPWAWKDPRNCILAPFWYRALGGRHAVVLVFRNPLEVAASLLKRNQMPKRYALSLWERYTADALRNSLERPTLVVDYGRLMEDTAGWLTQALSFLADLGVPVRDPSLARVQDDLPLELRHRTSADADVMVDVDVSGRQKELFALLRSLEGSHAELVLPTA